MTSKQKAAAFAAYTRQRAENILAIMQEHRTRKGLSYADLAKAIQMPSSTFDKRRREPGTFRLDEMWLICEVLEVPEKQRETIM